MEKRIKEIIEEVLIKSVDIYDIENESYLCNIQTTIDIKENMIINFKLKTNRSYNFQFKNYKVVVKRIELDAICDPMYDNKSLNVYVEVISVD